MQAASTADVNLGDLEKTPAAELANEKVSLSRKNTITHLPTACALSRAKSGECHSNLEFSTNITTRFHFSIGDDPSLYLHSNAFE
jgi:hypothetical protein